MSAHRVTPTKVAGRQAFVLECPEEGVRATVVPTLSMLCSSLVWRGEEVLGLPHDVATYAADGRVTGIPLLHPWANRLGGSQVAGLERRTVDPGSPLVPRDENGLAIHGLRLGDAGWTAVEHTAGDDCARIGAELRFGEGAWGDLFPFPHVIRVTMTLTGRQLAIETTLTPAADVAVPVSFGWHPYFRLPGCDRSTWRVTLPVGRRAVLDRLSLPTGVVEPFHLAPGPLGERSFDDLFTDVRGSAPFVLAGGGRRIEVRFESGYPWAQVYAPATLDVVAFEPMTAPTNALVTGEGLTSVAPGEVYTAVFTVRVDSGPSGG